MKNKQGCCIDRNTLSVSTRLIIILGGVLLWLIISQFDATILLGSTHINGSLWVIFLLGLVASVSTCLAVTGGIVVGYTELALSAHPRKTQFWLHLGRVLGFVLFGGILGLAGEKISYSLGFTAWLNLLISGILLFLALQILGLLPKLVRKTGHNHLIQQIQEYGSSRRCSTLVGAMTFFVPCGFTQMVQIMSLASGSLITGSLIMGIFALGTLPGLILLGIGTSYVKTSHKRNFEGGVALILIAFSLYSIQGSIALLGRSDTTFATNDNEYSSTLAGTLETEVIELKHDGSQVLPNDLVLPAGKNYEVQILPDKNGLGCMSTIALPSVNKSIYPVIAGEVITYQLINPSPGTYTFVCSSMGMSQGKITIE